MWWLLFISDSPASVVDRVVAVVGTQVVLASDVTLDVELTRYDPSPIPFWRAGDSEQRQVQAAIVRAAAGDIALYQPEPKDAQQRLEALKNAFPDGETWNGFLERWGLDEASLRGVLTRRMVVERYLQRNVQVPLTDEAVWTLHAQRLIEELRPRVRVRNIRERSK